MARAALFVSHATANCGVHQFGKLIGEGLQSLGQKFEWQYHTPGDRDSFWRLVGMLRPAVVVANYYPSTMPWWTPDFKVGSVYKSLGVIHEVNQQIIDGVDTTPFPKLFDGFMCPDSTVKTTDPRVFVTGRAIPNYTTLIPPPDRPTIGMFGFGISDKAFGSLAQRIRDEFPEGATMRLHVPYAQFGDADGVWAKAQRDLVEKTLAGSSIDLQVTHHFLPIDALLYWLSQNSLNAFHYAQVHGCRGVASTIDMALAVDRPISINETSMFRHVIELAPDLCIERTSLKEALERGTAPLDRLKQAWGLETVVRQYEDAAERVCGAV